MDQPLPSWNAAALPRLGAELCLSEHGLNGLKGQEGSVCGRGWGSCHAPALHPNNQKCQIPLMGWESVPSS